MSVETDNTGLVGLSNIGKDDINHGDKHAVAEGVTGILNDGDDVGTVGSHANQVTAGTVRELNSVDITGRANNVSNVGDTVQEMQISKMRSIFNPLWSHT